MSTTAFIADDAWDDVLETAARAAAAAVDAVGAAIVIVDGDLDHFLAHVGIDPGLEISRALHKDLGYVRLVMQAGDTVVVVDSALDARLRPELFELMGIRAFVGVPLRVDGIVVGALGAFDRRPRTLEATALLPIAARIEQRLVQRAVEVDSAMPGAVARRPAMRLLQAVQAGAVPFDVFLRALRLLPPVTVI